MVNQPGTDGIDFRPVENTRTGGSEPNGAVDVRLSGYLVSTLLRRVWWGAPHWPGLAGIASGGCCSADAWSRQYRKDFGHPGTLRRERISCWSITGRGRSSQDRDGASA